MTGFSDLPPHLIFGKILFSTKVAVQVSFILSKNYWDQDVVSSYSPHVLDLDEQDDFVRHKLNFYDQHQHEKFVRFVEGYLEHYRNNDHQLLDKLRLNMRLNSSEEVTILGRWLELAFVRGVKDLEISRPRYLQSAKLAVHPLSWMTTFANAKSLTSLKLAGVNLTAFENTWDKTDDFLPSLRNLSLDCLRLVKNDDSLYKLLHTCSSVENLSLIGIDLIVSELFRLPTRSLKSLEIRDCNLFNGGSETYPVQIDTLESFTWVGIDIDILFSWEVLLMAGKSLTFLKLECMRLYLDDFPSASNHYTFPSLKTVSFTEVKELDLLPLLSECPSLENLSLVKCHFKRLKRTCPVPSSTLTSVENLSLLKCHFKRSKRTCRVPSSSLKSLEVKYCHRLELLQVHEAKNLESFTFFSQPDPDSGNSSPDSESDSDSDSDSGSDSNSHLDSKCPEVILDNSFNLKNINICVTDDVMFSVDGHPPVSGGYLNLNDFFHRIAPCARRINIAAIEKNISEKSIEIMASSAIVT